MIFLCIFCHDRPLPNAKLHYLQKKVPLASVAWAVNIRPRDSHVSSGNQRCLRHPAPAAIIVIAQVATMSVGLKVTVSLRH